MGFLKNYTEERQQIDVHRWAQTLLNDPPQPARADTLPLQRLADFIVTGPGANADRIVRALNIILSKAGSDLLASLPPNQAELARREAVPADTAAVVFRFCASVESGSGPTYYFVAVAGQGVRYIPTVESPPQE